MSDLDQTFICEQLGSKLFTHRHCLRRQVDHQQATDPRTKQVFPGPASCGYCASGQCKVGAAIRTEHADVRVGSCETCGGAMVNVDACPRCADRIASEGVPKVLPAKPPPSERIWTHPVAEPPFLPPARRRPVLVANSATAASPRLPPPAEKVDPNEPMEPEATQDREGHEMPRGFRSEPCKGCGSKGTRHKANCSEAKGAGAAARRGRVAVPARAARPARRGRQEVDDVRLLGHPLGDLHELDVAQLIGIRDRVVEELHDRIERLDAESKALREALGAGGRDLS